VNRKPWRPGQIAHKQTVEEAISAYTRDAALAEFQEGFKGQIREGKVADLVLLTDNIFAAAAEELAAVRVAMTMCDGRIVYER
jgi:predicted amidohydrolase YtcJ